MKGKNFLKFMLVILGVVFTIALCATVLIKATADTRDKVSIVRVKNPEGIPAKTYITKENSGKYLEAFKIRKDELSDDMVKYTEIDKVYNTYILYFLRRNSFLYKDQLTLEKPLKNSWLYEFDNSLEAITIPYQFLEAGGDVLTPGDKIVVRASYDEEVQQAGGGESGGLGGPGTGLGGRPVGSEKQHKRITLFDSIEVKDLLNGKGHSVFEVYKEVLKLAPDKRDEVLKTDNFISSIVPKSLILMGNKEQAEKYAEYREKEGLMYTITILGRKGNDKILDELPILSNEVQSWLSGKK